MVNALSRGVAVLTQVSVASKYRSPGWRNSPVMRNLHVPDEPYHGWNFYRPPLRAKAIHAGRYDGGLVVQDEHNCPPRTDHRDGFICTVQHECTWHPDLLQKMHQNTSERRLTQNLFFQSLTSLNVRA